MITREQIPQVVGHPVHDAQGKKIGEAQHMYLDDATGAPEWVTVKTGFFGSNETFVPTRAAKLVQDHLEVPYDKEKIKGAPNVDVDSGGHLSLEEEGHLYRYYGIETRGTKAGTDEQRADSGGTSGQDGAEVAGVAGAAGVAGRGTRAEKSPPRTDKAAAGMAGSEAGAGTGAADFAAGPTGAPERLSADAGGKSEEMMTRSEEEMRVHVERQATGQARLHKYVEIEEVEQTVPVRHEEVRLEREPITGADARRAGSEINEAEQTVVLHEEKPVVDTEVVAKERVRMYVDEHTEQQTVHGRVRKEHIETEMTGPDTTPPGRDDRTR
jgi:uncharacterized protein (TIGR02271 family)